MAELTNLEEKLGEVIGLAQGAKAATDKIIKLEDAESVKDVLERMNEEAAETERRGTALASELEGRKTAILEKAAETKSKASTMLKTYIDQESDALDGFEFLTMAEAGEVGHWSVLKALNGNAGYSAVAELVEWALPIQQRHLKGVMDASIKLADEEDPSEPA